VPDMSEQVGRHTHSLLCTGAEMALRRMHEDLRKVRMPMTTPGPAPKERNDGRV